MSCNFIQNNRTIINFMLFIVNFISIALCIEVLSQMFCVKEAECNVDFSGVLGAFIGVCTTFVVGFQIWNHIYFTNKLDRLDVEKQEMSKKIDELDKARIECKYYNAYTIGRMRYQMAEGYEKKEDDQKYYWNALRALTNALWYAAEGGHDFDDTYNSLHGKIESAIHYIIKDKKHLEFDTNMSSLYEMVSQINDNIDKLKPYIKEHPKSYKYNKFGMVLDKWKEFTKREYSVAL